MTAFALILPATILALMAAARRGQGWRDAWLRALVITGSLIAVLTELFGAMHELRRGPLLLGWCLIAVLALLAAQRSWRRIHGLDVSGLRNVDWLALIGTSAIVGLTLLLALASPPNSADAMAYHLPRVVYWAQSASISFFPTAYFNQITLQPLAEYFVLHTYVLSGGDRFANLVQWLGSLGSIVGVSAIAAALGASVRTQTLTALFCATLPNGILQATGAKNDYLLALWLVAMWYFALRYAKFFQQQDLFAAALAFALALFTKATAYLFAPPLLAAVWVPVAWRDRKRLLAITAGLTACVLLINGPQYERNIALSGSPLGFDSAQGDGFFRWRNDRFGWRETVSNALRHASEQLGSANACWNQRVYDAVVRADTGIGTSVNDPATTWRWTKFEPPKNSNHEANANNRWHLWMLVLAYGWLAVRARETELRAWLLPAAAIPIAFLLFCFYLKWQPFMARMFLPLFVVAAPFAGWMLSCWRWPVLQAAVCLFLFNNARPYLFENWVRPLKGPASVLWTPHDSNYFNDMSQWGDQRESYRIAVRSIVASQCQTIGLDTSHFQLEYPFMALLREQMPAARFIHVGVENASSRYAAKPVENPCVILCLRCNGVPEKRAEYRRNRRVEEDGESLIFFSK